MLEESQLNTYKMPTKNRKTIIMVAFIANADSKALINAHIDAKRIVFFLPAVSAKKPQKCAEITMPKNAIDEISPCSVVDIFKSHFAYGSTKAMLIFSMVAPINTSPDAIIIRQLNRPVPAILLEVIQFISGAKLD